MSKVAFLIIDLQKAFIDDRKGQKIYDDTLIYVNETAKLFRKANQPVIVIRDIEEGDGPLFDTVDDLKVEETDIRMTKTYSNSFWETKLDDILKKLNVDFIVISGSAAEHCILATYNGARERGYQAVILQHGVFADYKEGLLDIYHNRALISYSAISYMLKHGH